MAEINIPLGKFNIAYKTFRGYAAPDEDVERPVPKDYVEKKLFSRSKNSWQPVQVDIPEGLCFIGHRSFEDCRGLTEVSIPNTISDIGSGAFHRCIALSHVTLPDSVKAIRSWAFAGCTSLTEINLPDSVTEIGDEAFLGCTALPRICVPDSVQTIGASAFANCTGLEEITIPDALCGEAKHMFGALGWVSWRWFAGKLQVNPALEKVFRADLKKRREDIAASVIASEDGETLDRYLALWDKVPLDFLDKLIVTSVKTQKPGITALLMQYKNSKYTQAHIEMAQQRRTEKKLGLRNRSVAEWRKIFVFHEEDGQIVITGCKVGGPAVEVPAVIGKKPVTAIARWIPRGYEEQDEPYTVILPEGLREIRKEAFQSSMVRSVHIPGTVTMIGEGAFACCSVLESIRIPSSVTEIGADAFRACRNLKNVSIFPGVTKIGACAFDSCNKLECVDIPPGVTAIEDRTFSYCEALLTVTLPDSISYVDFYAFAGCLKLLKLVLPAGVQKVSNGRGTWRFLSGTQVVAPRGSTTEETLQKAGIAYYPR